MIKNVFIAVLVLLSFVFTGCVDLTVQPIDRPESNGAAETEPTEVAQEDAAGEDAYILKASDPLYIRFNGIMDQMYLEQSINENGEISLLHIHEPIKAAGLTVSELADKIERLYIDGKVYKNVSVTVTMTAKVFFVQGEVRAPSQYPLTSGTTLGQAIATAGGYSTFAWKTKVKIKRGNDSKVYNMKEIDKDPSLDVKIRSGDVIIVPEKPW